ncbi:hypothetical protein [Hymenobacter sp. GOD-10R]|uniref:hypothetical protein n=1 Tax=Hymenobacter sp. GOD-10R TaxID=3093922 RepID=UPI002D76A504|nr:hypothetical protein [Hymenobacter sp. GOD-10R]WRQ30955.1 hypothetical protein SD425_11860 [Hymenobacter sp. GOD-10R]
MQVSKLKNHFLYWIDRFDRILNEHEFQNIVLYSFVNIDTDPEHKDLANQYLQEEQKLIHFIFNIIDKYDSNLTYSRLHYRWQSSCSESVKYLFTQKQIEIVGLLNKEHEQEIILGSKEQLYDFLQLGIRELLKVKIQIGDAYIEIGFDMSLIVQNIIEEKLIELVQQAGLHILRKWEQPMWDY